MSFKLAILTNYWKNSPGGGVKSYLIGLSDTLKIMGINLKVVYREGEDEENYKVKGPKPIFVILAFFRLCMIKPQIVHSHGPWYCLLAGHLYKVLFRAKLIHTFHSAPNSPLPLHGKILMQHLINKCDCVTFVSKALKADIENVEKLKFKKTAITYAGVSEKQVTPNEIAEFRRRFKIAENSIVLLAQGLTANRMKADGLIVLMRAVKSLIMEYPDVVLVATREGKYSNELKIYAEKLGLSNHTVFTGDIKNVFTPLKIADIYAHITFSEGGVSLAILEAMVSGKPIIATDIGGIPEVITNLENGILIEPGVDAVIKNVRLLLKDKNLAELLGQTAKITAERYFSWEACARRFLEIYNID